MMWRNMRPLDAYILRPLGEFCSSWQLLAGGLALRPEGKHVLDTPHGPALIIWVDRSGAEPMVSAVIGEAARRSPRVALRMARDWLDEHAAGCYAVPEGINSAYEKTLRFVGFTRVGSRWQWRS